MRLPGISAASWLVVLGFGALSVIMLRASLDWEYVRDTPLLNYVGWLIWEHGYAPYRDVFETSMPGTLGFHALVAGLGLTGDIGFILLAIAIVTGFAVFGALSILPFGPAGASMAVPTIVAFMFVMGPGWILKIDMVALLPISAALCLAVWSWPRKSVLRQFWIGVLFGVAGTMKPHLMLGAPIVVLAAYGIAHWTGRWRDLPRAALLIQIAVSLIGFSLPMAAMAGWLVFAGSWERFVFVLTEYLPLHLEKTDWQEFVGAAEKRRHTLIMTLRLGNFYPLALLAGLAALLGFWNVRRLAPREVILMAALCLLAVLYGLAPGLGGQFYVYYYFPCFFFCLLLIAVFVSLVERLASHKAVRAAAILGVAGLLLLFGERFFRPDALFPQQRLQALVEMEDALETWVPEGGHVQPIDWTSGVVHAMLRREVLPATPYLYDYHFHHHVGGQINWDLRQAFMAALEQDPPEVFAEWKGFLTVFGVNTSDRFPQRDAFVEARYTLVEERDAFRLYLRNDLVAP